MLRHKLHQIKKLIFKRLVQFNVKKHVSLFQLSLFLTNINTIYFYISYQFFESIHLIIFFLAFLITTYTLSSVLFYNMFLMDLQIILVLLEIHTVLKSINDKMDEMLSVDIVGNVLNFTYYNISIMFYSFIHILLFCSVL